jgi:hypothetical protein
MSDLVERLRRDAQFEHTVNRTPLMIEAADRIAELETENERLRRSIATCPLVDVQAENERLKATLNSIRAEWML